MKKAGVAGLAALLALWIAFQVRPGGRATAAASDYPLEEGLRWTYRGPGNLAVVREVGASLDLGGRRYAGMKFVLPLLGAREIPMRRSDEGIVTWREGRDHLLLRFPMRAGDSWTIDLPGVPEIAECRVAGPEEIEFAGRRAAAAKLEVRRRDRQGRAISTDAEWYAPGFGLVKMEVTLGIRAAFVLESFGPRN